MNSWKIATAAIALVVVSAVGTSLGTAYFMRPAPPESADTIATAPASAPAVEAPRVHRAMPARSTARAASTTSVRPAVVRPSDPVVAQPTVTREAPQAPVSPAESYPVASPETRPTVAQAPVRPVASSTAADCATGGERAMRIAKPGLLGAALGAGMGAAGGAIANGGKAAGKGAIIGGLAGVALGSAYGAYKTKQECGTIMGNNGNGFAGDNVAAQKDNITYTSTGLPTATEAPFQSRNARDARETGGITIFNAR